MKKISFIRIISIVTIMFIVVMMILSLTGCTDADIASSNVSKEADQFRVKRRIVFYLSPETTYTVEQLDYSEVSKYDYEIIFKPKSIVPYKVNVE